MPQVESEILGNANVRWLEDEKAKARLLELFSSFHLVAARDGFTHDELLRGERQFLARVLPPLQGDPDPAANGPQLVRWRDAFGPIDVDEPLERLLPDLRQGGCKYEPLSPDALPRSDFLGLVGVLEGFTGGEACYFHWLSWNGDLNEIEAKGWAVAEGTLSSLVELADEKARGFLADDGYRHWGWHEFNQPALWWGGRIEGTRDDAPSWCPSWMVYANSDCNSMYVAGWSAELLHELLAAPELEVLDATAATAID